MLSKIEGKPDKDLIGNAIVCIPHVNLCILPFLSCILNENVFGMLDARKARDLPVSPPSEANFKELSLVHNKLCVSTLKELEILFQTTSMHITFVFHHHHHLELRPSLNPKIFASWSWQLHCFQPN